MVSLDLPRLGACFGVFTVMYSFVGSFLKFIIGFGLVVFYWVTQKFPQRQRSMSFSSEIMSQGGFTEKANAFDTLINAATYFNTNPSIEKLKETVVATFVKYERFTSVPRPFAGGVEFVPVEMNIDDHMIETKLPSAEALKLHIEELMVKRLNDDSRPLWEIHSLINEGEGTSCLLIRFHHCIADGISIVQLFTKGGIMTNVDGSPLKPSPLFQRAQKEKKFFSFSFGLLGRILNSFKEVATLADSAFDTDIAFNDPLKKELSNTGKREIVKVPTMSLERVKAIKNKHGVTVNDVMMTCTSGAIHRYCSYMKDPVFEDDTKLRDVMCRALLPIAFPRKESTTPTAAKNGALRNLWCFLSTKMAVGAKDPAARLKATAEATTALKSSPTALVQLAVQNFLGRRLPYSVTRDKATATFARHSIVFSNVPGPDHEVAFAGEPCVEFQMYFPNLITQVGILSYNGKVMMNFCVDPRYVKESHKLAEFFEEEMAALAEGL